MSAVLPTAEHYPVEGPGFYYCPTCDSDGNHLYGLCVWPCRPALLAERDQMERALIYALAEVEVLRAKVDDADNEADHWHRMAHHLAEGGGF